MRLFRTILGMLLLTMGLPALLVGAGLWTTMQHRDAGGAYSGTLQHIAAPGYAVVVGDLDALVRADAPFARMDETRLRLTGTTAGGPAFIGIARAEDAARYLDDVAHSRVATVDLGTGALPVVTRRITGGRTPSGPPARQTFWRASGNGHLDWNPADLRDNRYSLVVMNASARPGVRLNATAELRPGWLNQATWALVILGSLLIVGGMMTLAWPGRRREIIYVVEPSQVPELAKRIGAPLPIGRPDGGLHAVRPRTLADAAATLTAPPATPELTWPPTAPDPSARSGGRHWAAPNGPARSAEPGSPTAEPPAPRKAPAARAGLTPVTSPTDALRRADTARRPVAAARPTVVPDQPAAEADPATPGRTGTTVARTTVAPLARPQPADAPPSGPRPVDPRPVDPLAVGPRPVDVSPARTKPLDPPPPRRLEALPGRPTTERQGRRRATEQPTGERPIFEASAVEAWVAETAAARRARDAQPRPAAVPGAEQTTPRRAATEQPAPADGQPSGRAGSGFRPTLVTGSTPASNPASPASPSPISLTPGTTQTAPTVDPAAPPPPMVVPAAAPAAPATAPAAPASSAVRTTEAAPPAVTGPVALPSDEGTPRGVEAPPTATSGIFAAAWAAGSPPPAATRPGDLGGPVVAAVPPPPVGPTAPLAPVTPAGPAMPAGPAVPAGSAMSARSAKSGGEAVGRDHGAVSGPLSEPTLLHVAPVPDLPVRATGRRSATPSSGKDSDGVAEEAVVGDPATAAERRRSRRSSDADPADAGPAATTTEATSAGGGHRAEDRPTAVVAMDRSAMRSTQRDDVKADSGAAPVTRRRRKPVAAASEQTPSAPEVTLPASDLSASDVEAAASGLHASGDEAPTAGAATTGTRAARSPAGRARAVRGQRVADGDAAATAEPRPTRATRRAAAPKAPSED